MSSFGRCSVLGGRTRRKTVWLSGTAGAGVEPAPPSALREPAPEIASGSVYRGLRADVAGRAHGGALRVAVRAELVADGALRGGDNGARAVLERAIRGRGRGVGRSPSVAWGGGPGGGLRRDGGAWWQTTHRPVQEYSQVPRSGAVGGASGHEGGREASSRRRRALADRGAEPGGGAAEPRASSGLDRGDEAAPRSGRGFLGSAHRSGDGDHATWPVGPVRYPHGEAGNPKGGSASIPIWLGWAGWDLLW